MKTTGKDARDKLVESKSFKGLDDDFGKAIKDFAKTFAA